MANAQSVRVLVEKFALVLQSVKSSFVCRLEQYLSDGNETDDCQDLNLQC